MLEGRIATQADIMSLVPLFQEQELADIGVQSNSAIWETRLSNWFVQPLSAVLVIVNINGKPAAMATLIPHFPAVDLTPSWMVKGVFVAKNHRRRGVGRYLLTHCGLEAQRRGACRLDITVDRSNDQALRFYNQLGGEDTKKCYLRWALDKKLPS